MNESVQETISKFKWFSSLSRLKNDQSSESNNGEPSKKAVNVFYTIRRKLQKRFNSTRKVKASDSYTNVENENTNRIVLESESQQQLDSCKSNSLSDNRLVTFGISDEETPEMVAIKKELSQYGWYWGNLNRTAAQRKLKNKQNGSFLVRNSQTEKNQFTLSFRSAGVTLHCRINLDEDKNW